MVTGKMLDNQTYMRRALQLARNGRLDAHPNPMVGAVIVSPDGNIIGEGWHRRCGEGHAEVNAINSVKNPELLKSATIFVTLEPCSHYGKTPPCAKLIIDRGIPEVVVGCLDPFEKVSGQGINMLRQAGVKVTTGVLEDQCKAINHIFMTAHTLHRPYIILKWAESADGYIDGKISTPLTSTMVHHVRATIDAILIGSGTTMADNPRLDTRLISGRSPLRVILDRRGRIPVSNSVFRDDNIIYVTSSIRHDLPKKIQLTGCDSLKSLLDKLYLKGITSLLVEGGRDVLQSFINEGLYDEMRIEQSPSFIKGNVKSPLTSDDHVH
ncbi:MAG: bifunctional diaminohydroxyphosphoribosylaminopyrimidine deaminase/5-amino-6-(5-phosphoribosylamino)uracil reductase RibD [Lachnoclostridium sp.]|nr:bifunctional diaminohydroxyphosphoribosylaminopyrimidine deaminase/5-amino-6-(5-phosphoribosylamino)uracil reductase RibD [Lachnoclostridium sp.]